MWEVRKLYVTRFKNSDIIFIGDRLDRAESYCPTGIEGDGVIEEWMCAVRARLPFAPEIAPLAKCDPDDADLMRSAVIEVAPSTASVIV